MHVLGRIHFFFTHLEHTQLQVQKMTIILNNLLLFLSVYLTFWEERTCSATGISRVCSSWLVLTGMSSLIILKNKPFFCQLVKSPECLSL